MSNKTPSTYVSELIDYALATNLIVHEDKVFLTNAVISLIFSIGGGARTLVAFVARTGEITCFLLCVAIMILYFWLRYKNDYEKGIWTDLLIVIVLFVPFYKLCGYLHPMVENWQWLRDFLDAILC